MTTQIQRRIIRTIADAHAFVRSVEANQAVASVTHEQLIEEQIRRNGDTDQANSSQYNPYSFDPMASPPASAQALERANFLGGSDLSLPTRVERVTRLKEVIDTLVEQVRALPPEDVSQLKSEDEILDQIVSVDDFQRAGLEVDENNFVGSGQGII